VGEATIGKQVTLEIFRDGRLEKVSVTLASGDSAAAVKPSPAGSAETWLGLTVEELPASRRGQGASGVIVSGVETDSPAAESGIQRGDIILSINQKRTGSLKEYAVAMNDAKRKGSAALLIRRGNMSIYFALKLK